MLVEPSVSHTPGQQLTVWVEGGQDKKFGGVTFERLRSLVPLLTEVRGADLELALGEQCSVGFGSGRHGCGGPV